MIHQIQRTLSNSCHQNRRGQKQWHDKFKMLREKDFQPRLLCQVKLTFENKEESKAFLNTQKLREFIVSKPTLQEILKRVHQAEIERH